jgi:hypothetical protein
MHLELGSATGEAMQQQREMRGASAGMSAPRATNIKNANFLARLCGGNSRMSQSIVGIPKKGGQVRGRGIYAKLIKPSLSDVFITFCLVYLASRFDRHRI